MVRWEERGSDTKIYHGLAQVVTACRPTLTSCKHSEGSSATQVGLQPQQKSYKPRLTALPGYTFKSGAKGRSKEIVDPASLHCLVIA